VLLVFVITLAALLYYMPSCDGCSSGYFRYIWNAALSLLWCYVWNYVGFWAFHTKVLIYTPFPQQSTPFDAPAE
jgi:hypothetical protein